MAIVTGKKQFSKVVPASIPSSSNKHKIWLAIGIFIIIFLVAVIAFYIVRPTAFFGKAISLTTPTRGDLVAENVPLTTVKDATTGITYLTSQFISDSKPYVLYLTKTGTQTVPLVCPCVKATLCPTLTQCQEQYSTILVKS